MSGTNDSNEQLESASGWMDARESDLAESAFSAMEQGDVIAQRVAESQLAFHRIIREAVEETELL